MSIHAQLSRMTAPHAPASPVSVHPSEDAGVPLGTSLRYEYTPAALGTTRVQRWIDGEPEVQRAWFVAHGAHMEPFAGRTPEAARAKADASYVSPVPAPTPEAVRQAVERVTIATQPDGSEFEQFALDEAYPDVGIAEPLLLADVRTLLDYLATPQPPREGEIHDAQGCPRGLTGCTPLARIASSGYESFMCCGETTGAPVPTDRLRLCVLSTHDHGVDVLVNLDERDAVHTASVLLAGLSALGSVAITATDILSTPPSETRHE